MEARKPSPLTMVIFGATGDLARRKLLPALVRLKSLGLLPGDFNVVGFSTRPFKDEEFRAFAREAAARFSRTKPETALLGEFIQQLSFVSSPFEREEGYEELSKRLAEIDKRCGASCTKLFYLATPPSFFPVIVEMLFLSGISSVQVPGPPKIIIEKPFGRDLKSARMLTGLVNKYFDESQIFRIDHYLGKETVQNMLFFRFANGIYEPIWNRRYIDHVQITAAETLGIEERGKYFEEAGIMRDMVQNHLLQLLSLVAMEPPISMEAEEVRRKKLDLLSSLRPIEPGEVERSVVRGQYGGGSMNGVEVPGYREEKNVSKDSVTETYVALKALVDNWRWADVPFYLRAGKRLKKPATEISVHFKAVPFCLFEKTMVGCPERNVLALKIQPDEGIAFQFNVKRPGTTNYMERVVMDFSYREAFRVELPEAYERLLLDAMVGDSTLYPNRELVEKSWEFITRILEGWEGAPAPRFPNYEPGSWGPLDADNLLRGDGREWRNP